MIHRTEIYAVDIKSTISDLIDDLDALKYSRIPVYEDTIDDIKGIVYTKDLIKYLKKQKDVKMKTMMHDALFVSENKPINELFKDMQKHKVQMAIVVDEYGGTSGIITMEDILEELVGNIFDEYDEIELDYEKIDDNTFLINGDVSIYDLKKILGIEVPEGEYDTLSGYLIELMGRIPEDDEKPVVETEKVTYKIEEYEDKRILKVKACKNQTVETKKDIEKE